MKNKIKKLVIKIEACGFYPFESGRIISREITITNDGNVAIAGTIEEGKDRLSSKIVTAREVENVGEVITAKILKRAKKDLLKHLEEGDNPPFLIADCALDVIKIWYEDGTKVVGWLKQLTYELDDVMNFYDYISEKLCIYPGLMSLLEG